MEEQQGEQVTLIDTLQQYLAKCESGTAGVLLRYRLGSVSQVLPGYCWGSASQVLLGY